LPSRVTQAARDGKAGRDELSGSTITLTSLGPLGGIAATPIINHPEVAIIGPNKLVERPVIEGAFITRRMLMNLSASFDHRIIDGYDAARFVQQLKRLLEQPALLFLESP
jgi:2-oxoisovalerate dehydrogenase E2 component (dihydrolipoyl transacylase)